jgi:aminotransferase
MFRAMINEGDEVLIPQPSYVSYEPCAVLADAVPVIINLKNENQFRLTPKELEAAITPKSKILVLPFPNNPTGGIMEKKDLEAIRDIIIKKSSGQLSGMTPDTSSITWDSVAARVLSE